MKMHVLQNFCSVSKQSIGQFGSYSGFNDDLARGNQYLSSGYN